jgi:hypothetical protein
VNAPAVKPLSHNIEMEQALLGAILVNNAAPQVSKDGKVITKDGKVQYSTILDFCNAFSSATVAAVLDYAPGAFDDGGTA